MPSKMPASDAEPTTATRTVTGGLSGGSAGRTLDTFETLTGAGGAGGAAAEELAGWVVGRQASASRAARPSAQGAAMRGQPSLDVIGPPLRTPNGTRHPRCEPVAHTWDG